MKKRKRIPCVVLGCSNHTDEGEFVGVFCRPCYDFAAMGQGQHSQSYRNALRFLSQVLGLAVTKILIKVGDPTSNSAGWQTRMDDEDLADLSKAKG
jgi:hypothetical protein